MKKPSAFMMKKRRGASAAEYAFVTGAVALVAIGSISAMSSALNSAMEMSAQRFGMAPMDQSTNEPPQATEMAKPIEYWVAPPETAP